MTKNSSKKSSGKLSPTTILLAILLLAVAGNLVWTLMNNQKKTEEGSIILTPGNKPGPGGKPSPTATPQPTPTPTPTALREGADTYYISVGSNAKGPSISSLTLDPLDPKVGQKQTLTTKVTYTSPVQEVSIKFKSDNKTRDLQLTRINGTDTNGEWQTSWTVDDTVLYKYIMTITAISGSEKSSVGVAPRQ